MNSIAIWPSPGARPPVSILGVRFDNVTIAETLELIEQMIASRRPHYAVTANVDFVVQAQSDVELRRIFFEAHLVLCDGTPLVWASRLLGNRLRERVAGADVVPLLLQLAERKQYRVFFLGAAPESIERAVTNTRRLHPRLTICGFYSPPFNQLLEMDHEEIRRRILEAQPDLLFVSLGCPKQEKWVAMNYRTLGVPVTIGVGATIDFLAGQVKRAPVWMQRNGLEWIFRLIQEPRRLYRRYSKDIWVFGRRLATQLWQLRDRWRDEAADDRLITRVTKKSGDGCIVLPLALNCADLPELASPFREIASGQDDCFLDLSRVEFIDSTGMAALMTLRQQLALQDRALVLIAPGRAVTNALSFTRLESFFDSAQTLAEAREMLRTRARESKRSVQFDGGSAFRALVWYGEITAVNAEDVWERTRNHIEQAVRWRDASQASESLVVDLSVLRFIDSSGLGLMVRARKFARQGGINLRFTNLQPAVMNVVQIARLEKFLLDQKRERFPLLSQIRIASPHKTETESEAAAMGK